MKKTLILSYLLLATLFIGCTKTESKFDENEASSQVLTLTASQTNLLVGATITFNVISSTGDNLNNASVFFINGSAISGNSFTFNSSGTYLIKAEYQSNFTNVLELNVIAPPATTTQFVNRVLVEEYSGTWCGNCPRILYGTELLKQQTDKSVSVQIHLYGNDPFITNHGNQLASSLGINGVPTGRINRTINWNGPQYQNINQVLSEIKPSSAAGISINSTASNGTINATVKMGFSNTNLSAKLVVYLVEDNLFHTQSNYSSNLYGGLSAIPNFEYDGVLRSVVSSIDGDAVVISQTTTEQNYTFALPSNVLLVNNCKLVALLIDTTTNAVINVREASIGSNQNFEVL